MALSNVKNAAKGFALARGSEELGSSEGIYIGKSAVYRLPFFLDLNATVNPHVLILGMTGSGKTYLMRSIAARFLLYTDVQVAAINWNGEYSMLEKIAERNRIELIENGNEVGRQIQKLLDNMQKDSKEKPKGVKKLFFIDEAWKVMKNGHIADMLREGRKHGFGVVMATQLAKDVINYAISNAATIIVFKLQNSEDFKLLNRSGIIADADAISSLPVGTCMVLQRYKSSPDRISRTFVNVGAVSYEPCIIRGSMEFEIDMKAFESRTNGRLGKKQAEEIIAYVESKERAVDLRSFIKALLDMGIGRDTIVPYVKELGVDDLSIAHAYNSLDTVDFDG